MKNTMKKLIILALIIASFGVISTANAAGAPFIPSANATNITATSATLNGVVNPNGSPTTAWFETNTGGPFGTQSMGGGTSSVSMTPYTLTGLSPNTTYQFRIEAYNSLGNTISSWVSFTTSSIPTPPPTPSPTVNLTAADYNIPYNTSTTLYWNTTNATSCNGSGGSNGWSGYLNPNGGSFNTGNLTSTTTYYITCTNSTGSDSDSVTVHVEPQPTPAPTVNISASPDEIQAGGSSTISWNSTNADYCIASGGTSTWYGTQNTSGSFTATNILNTTTFTIVCYGSGGSDSDSVTVYTNIIPTPSPTVNLTAADYNIPYNTSTTLYWNTTNATSCNGSGGSNGWSGYLNPNGGSFNTGNLTSTTTYYITCTNSTGSDSDSVTVKVGSQPENDNPTIQTNNASSVDEDSATLNGFVDANDVDNVIAWFEWGTSSSNLNNDTTHLSYGSTTGTHFDYHITGLNDDTTYYFRAVAQNDEGQEFYGSIKNFRTDEEDDNECDNCDPDVETRNATNIDDDRATLRGYVDTDGQDVRVWFEWGERRSDLDEDTDRSSYRDNNRSFSETIRGLDANTTYYFRAIAQNRDGDRDRGSIKSFRTDSNGSVNLCSFGNCRPTAVTTLATNVDHNSARLNGLGIIPTTSLTNGYFQWGTTTALGRTTPSSVIGSTGSNGFYSSLFSLSPNTTYYYRAVVTNQYGTSLGDIRSFRTGSAPSIGVVAGASTSQVVHTVTQVVEEEEDACPCPKLVWLAIENNSEAVYAGQIVEYRVRYKNVTEENLEDVVVQVLLPRELSFMSTTRGYFSEVNNAIVVDLGNVFADEDGSFIITAGVNSNAEIGKLVVTTANLAYTHSDDGTQEDVFAYSKQTIAERFNLAGGAIFSGGFWPTTLLGWLFLLLLLLLLLLIAREIYSKRKRQTRVNYYSATQQTPSTPPTPPVEPSNNSYDPVNNPPRYY